MADAVRVRRARRDEAEALAPLVYLPAATMYDRLAGSRERALRIIAAELRRGDLESAWVAERDGAIAGAMVAYPFRDDEARMRRILRSELRHTPPWRWPTIGWLWWRGHHDAPAHPPDALYVDALATDPAHRRTGVARALLGAADRIAAERGLRTIVLDTHEKNEDALRLYRSTGFSVVESREVKVAGVTIVALMKDVG